MPYGHRRDAGPSSAPVCVVCQVQNFWRFRLIGWLERAACRGLPTEMFFSEPVEEAVKVCRRCEVIAACDAVARGTRTEYGVWGGRDRERAQKRRKAA